MYKLKLILLSILISTSVFAQQDSPTISELKEAVILLETKVNVLNDANTKILRTVVGTLAIILTFFVGIGIANYFSNKKLNEQKFDNYTSGLDEQFAQFGKSTNDSIVSVQTKWKSDFTEYEKKVSELVSSKTNEIQTIISKSLDSEMNKKLYQLEIKIAESKLLTLKLEHELDKSKPKQHSFPPNYINPNEFNRIIEMCYLSHKIAVAYRYTLPLGVNSNIDILHKYLKETPITPKMNDELYKLITKLKSSQYNFTHNIEIIERSVQIDKSKISII